MLTRLTVALVILAAGLAPAASADAPGLLLGKTSQGKKFRLRIGTDGKPARAVFNWRADCRRPGYEFRGGADFRSLGTVTPTSFSRTGTSFGRDGTLRMRFYSRFSGERVSASRWSGTYRVAVRVKRGGRILDYCRSPRIRWTVTR